MSEKNPRAFRWLGPGVLHIQHPDGTRLVIPPEGKGSIVRKAENLAPLGAAFIEQLIKDGKAEAINIVDGIIEAVNPSQGSMSEEELKQAQKIAQDSADASAQAKKNADTAKAAGDPRANVQGPAPSTLMPDPPNARAEAGKDGEVPPPAGGTPAAAGAPGAGPKAGT